jgi:site-specific DNA-cytosine methylase
MMFAESAHLSDQKAVNQKAKSFVTVPTVDFLFAGSSCVSRSKLNRNAASNKGCVRAGTEETCKTFESVRVGAARKKPRSMILKNVSELAQGDDLSYIEEQLREVGYAVETFEVYAELYGSCAKRARIYVVASRVSDASGKLDIAHALLMGMQLPTGTFTPADFLLSHDEALSFQLPPKEQRIAKSEGKYETEHEDTCLERGWQWPVADAENDRSCGSGLSGLSRRRREAAYMLHNGCDLPEQVEMLVHSRAHNHALTHTRTPACAVQAVTCTTQCDAQYAHHATMCLTCGHQLIGGRIT